LFSSTYIEVKSTFEVSTNGNINVDGLLSSFKLVLGLGELFSILSAISKMNERLPLKASSKMRLITPSIPLKVIQIKIATFVGPEITGFN
jgi:hypothetical protein